MLPLPRSCLNILCTQHFFKGDRIFAQPTDLHSSQERWKNRRIRSQQSSPRHCRCQAEHPLPLACPAFSRTTGAPTASPPGIRSDMRECTGGTRPSERHRKAQNRPQRTAKPIVKFTVPLPLEPFTAVRQKQPLSLACPAFSRTTGAPTPAHPESEAI